MRRYSLLVALTALIAISGCRNPADDVPQATVGEAQPVTDEGSAAPADETAADEATAGDEAAEAEGLSWVFDASTSSVGFVGSKVTGSHDGGFRDFAGTVNCPDRADLTSCRVEFTVQMASVFTDTERLTGHLQNDDFFDVPNHPTATFVSTAIAVETATTMQVTGNLTLRGTTKSITFPATVQMGPDGFEMSSEFALNRMDFGVSYTGREDDLIREEVVIKLDIKGRAA